MGVTAKDLREAREWIECVTGEHLEGTLQEALKSGVVLCNLLNKLKPGSVKPPSHKALPFVQMENIAAYLATCKSLGMPEFELFLTSDLYENQNIKAVVLNIHSLGRISQSFYSGPMLGVKLATANHRDFTDEQLNAGKHVVGGFGLGSHASAQADAKAKLGLAPAPAAAPPAPEPSPAPAPDPSPAPAAAAAGGGFFSGWFGAAAVPPTAPPAAPPSAPPAALPAAHTATPGEVVHPPGMMTRTMEELVRRTSSLVIDTAAAEGALDGKPTAEQSAPEPRESDPSAEAREWVEAVLGERLAGQTLHDALKSGVALCRLADRLMPGCCPPPSHRKLPFIQMENIEHYLKATADSFGVPSFQSFTTSDLYENKNMGAVVTNLHALGSICQQRGIAGPTLGVKLATANHRDFTDEQLNAGKHVVGGFGLGSHASAQADAKAKLGLTPAPAAAPPAPEPSPAPAPDPSPAPEQLNPIGAIVSMFGAINNFFADALGDSARHSARHSDQEELQDSHRSSVCTPDADASPVGGMPARGSAMIEDKSTAMAIELAMADAAPEPPRSPHRTLSEIRSAFNKIEDPRIHLPGFENSHRAKPRGIRPWAPQGTSLVSELPSGLGGGARSPMRRKSTAAQGLTKAELEAKIEEAKRAARAAAEADIANALERASRRAPSMHHSGSSWANASSAQLQISDDASPNLPLDDDGDGSNPATDEPLRQEGLGATAEAPLPSAAADTLAPLPDEGDQVARAPRTLWALHEEDARTVSRPARVSAIADARASARAQAPLRVSMRPSGGVGDVNAGGQGAGGDESVVAANAEDGSVATDDDVEFTDDDMKAVEDCLFLLRSRPSRETTYDILDEVGRSSHTWRSVFLLLDGLGALAQPLLRCVMGGTAGPMRGTPPEEDLALIAEILHEVRSLMGELGMECLIGSHADLAKLRSEFGLATAGEIEPMEAPEHEMLTALALCVAPLRDYPTCSAQIGAGPLPLLLAVAYYSPAGRIATLAACAHAAALGGEAGRLGALVGVCSATHITTPPREGVTAAAAVSALYRARLSVAAISLGLLNILISSAEVLDDRIGLREECLDLGLASAIGELSRVVQQHESNSMNAHDKDCDRGHETEAYEEVERQMATLSKQLELYAKELASDAELAETPLEEYRGLCVLLTTSVAVSKKVKEQCKAIEELLDGMSVGYTVIDGALPARARVRNALWGVSGKAIGSSVLKKDYPQVFVDNKYIGGYDQIAHLLESDTVTRTKVHRMAATVADGQVGFDETFGAFYGKPKEREKIR